MAYPVLAAKNTWFAPTNDSIVKDSITEIEIMDNYAPDDTVTVVDSWDASDAKDGSIMCYVIGTKLIMTGNGSGKIALNSDSSQLFSYFNEATAISNLYLLDSSNVINFFMAFYCLSKITSLDVNDWDISNVQNAGGMFGEDKLLSNIDVSNWDTRNLIRANQMFYNCNALTQVDLSRWKTSNITTFYGLFMFCHSLQTIGDVSDWDTSSVTAMSCMFSQCKQLTDLNIANWNLSNVTTCENMFSECPKLNNIDVSKWNTSLCTNMSFMFYQCSSLKEIDVSNWDVSKVTNFDHFAAHANLKRKGIENWKTTSATNMNALFHNCAEEELDLSGWDVSKNQFFCQMFENSPNLKRIKGLDKWNTSAGLGFDGMFERCSKLEEVDLSSFNTTKAKNGTAASNNGHKTATLQNMFLSCNNLKKVTVGPNFSINGNGSNTTAANKAILPTPATDYIEGADGNWYTFNGEAYAPNAMKDKTAETYYASPVMVYDADVIVKNSSLIDTAKAIREKNGKTTHYTPAQFGAAIRAM